MPAFAPVPPCHSKSMHCEQGGLRRRFSPLKRRGKSVSSGVTCPNIIGLTEKAITARTRLLPLRREAAHTLRFVAAASAIIQPTASGRKVNCRRQGKSLIENGFRDEPRIGIWKRPLV